MNKLDKKVDETLSSLDGIKKAEMPTDLYEKILKRIENQRNSSVRIVPMWRVLMAAAVFSGIVVLNILGLVSSENSANTIRKDGGGARQKTGAQTFASTYFNDSHLNY